MYFAKGSVNKTDRFETLNLGGKLLEAHLKPFCRARCIKGIREGKNVKLKNLMKEKYSKDVEIRKAKGEGKRFTNMQRDCKDIACSMCKIGEILPPRTSRPKIPRL